MNGGDLRDTNGKYDDYAQNLKRMTKAAGGVVLIVIEGTRGTGMSVNLTELHARALPTILRDLATLIENTL
jgi:hypothetical protein